MTKERVIVFGAGKLFAERRNLIEKYGEIEGILDNKACELSIPSIETYLPEELVHLPKVPIIIMSDYLVPMVLQVSRIIGEDECSKRVKIGRICYPVEEEENVLANAALQIIVESGNVYCVLEDGQRVLLDEKSHYMKDIYRVVSQKRDVLLNALIAAKVRPIDAFFGRKRGEPIDRYYIEKFLDEHKEFIRGRCLEIAEDTYTKKFGGNRVTDSVMLHVEGWGDNVIKGNLETGDGIVAETYDSMIITQTLMCIYNVEAAVRNIFVGLKKGGSALVTVSGISQIARYDDDNWGMFHSFYMSGLKKLFYPVFGEENVEIIHYGNVKTAMAFLYGAVREEVRDEDFNISDMDYPVIYGIHAIRR